MTSYTTEPDTTPGEIATIAAKVLGSPAVAELWLQHPAIALDGRRPADLLTTEQGIQSVRELLLRIEHGVYT